MGERVFSYGGGVQSTAALVLAAQGRIDFRVFLFCNVGADSENPATLDYIRDVARPYAKRAGIEIHELSRVFRRGPRKGQGETIYGHLTRKGSKSIPIPMRMSRTGMPGSRSCTVDFKIKLSGRWLKERGATATNPATVGLGISLDEFHRMRTASREYELLEYPLIDLRLDRGQCISIIRDAGLPVPPKSSCYFCPFHSHEEWRRLRDEEPGLFALSVDLERLLNERRAAFGKDPMYMHRALIPLDLAVGTAKQAGLWDEIDVCESGYCLT